MKVVADRDVCIGAGMCVTTAPELFDQDDHGIVVVLEDEPAAATTARRAVGLCPSGALSVVEDGR